VLGARRTARAGRGAEEEDGGDERGSALADDSLSRLGRCQASGDVGTYRTVVEYGTDPERGDPIEPAPEAVAQTATALPCVVPG
jgi:hypothetical protein